jgi:hypothetical protein
MFHLLQVLNMFYLMMSLKYVLFITGLKYVLFIDESKICPFLLYVLKCFPFINESETLLSKNCASKSVRR